MLAFFLYLLAIYPGSENDGDSNERRWPAGNQPIDTPSVDKRRDEERGDRNRRARKGK